MRKNLTNMGHKRQVARPVPGKTRGLIIKYYEGGQTRQAIAKKYGVAYKTVCAITSGMRPKVRKCACGCGKRLVRYFSQDEASWAAAKYLNYDHSNRHKAMLMAPKIVIRDVAQWASLPISDQTEAPPLGWLRGVYE